LGLNINDDIALAAVKTDFVSSVADTFGDFASDLFEVNLLFSDTGLTKKHDHVALSCGFHSDFSVGVDFDASVEDTVRHLIANFIGVAFAD